jgi:lipoprotein-releasing system permease protein
MNWPYELQIGWRYTRAGRAGRRNRFISFISGVSMLGIALGVAALIIVLSVMNGFQKEVRARMLSVISHIEVSEPGGGALPDWRKTAEEARRNPEVVGAAPFVSSQALIVRGDETRGVIVRGIDPDAEATVTPLAARLRSTTFARLVPGEWNVVLGGELARSLGVRSGDKVTIVLPGGQVTPAGIVPRLRTLTVAGTFDVGHYEYDSTLALVALEDAAKLFRTEGPTGVQLRLRDLDDAPVVGAELAERLGPGVAVRDWTSTNRNWFSAVQIEKRLMFIILTLIVAVAAFNLVSTLVMTGDRQARRHRDPAHARRDAALDHGDLRRPGRGVGDHRHALRRRARAPRRVQHRRHRAVHRAAAARHVPAEQRLPDQPDAERSAAGRHRSDRGDLARPRVRRDDLSELAREPAATRRSAAL